MANDALPKIEDFKTSDGQTELRELFAVAIFNSLTVRERSAVKKHLNLGDLPQAA